MRHLAIAVVSVTALAATAAPSAAAQPRRPAAVASADANYRLTCDGPFSRRTTEADLRRMYGAANVRHQMVSGAEGDEVPATVLFENDESRRAEVFWTNDARRTGFSSIRTAGRRWISRDGLRVGSPIADAERANGRPFILSGFGWDYGGMVQDWRGGRLDMARARCHVGFDFSPVGTSNSNEAVGDAPFRSDSRAMRSQHPAVGRISLSFDD